MAKADVTPARLRDLLNYDPETGLFTQRETRRRWLAGRVMGSICKDGYVLVTVDGTQYRAHRLAFLYMTGEWPKGDPDHINGKRPDNRWSNLRDVSRQVNLQNRRAVVAASGLLGAYWNAGAGRWTSSIRAGGKTIYLGLFDTPEEANQVHISAKRRLHVGCTI